jgi:hypothetical protein
MNAKKSMGILLAMTASVLSVSVEAAPEQKGLQACVDALANKLSSAQGSPVLATLSEDNLNPNRQLGLSTTFSLDAYTPDAMEVVARMDCTVNARGKVLRLVRLPNDAPEAKQRSL